MKNLKRFFVRITVYTIIAIILSLFTDIDSVTIVNRICDCIERCRYYKFMNKVEDNTVIKSDFNNLIIRTYSGTKSD